MTGRPVADITGRRYGRLIAVELAGVVNRNARWRCVCDCGKAVEVRAHSLKALHGTKSCGCLAMEETRRRATVHGHCASGTATGEYRRWVSMQQRCYNQHSKRFPSYGGMGISVCDRWRTSFEAFMSDMGAQPSPGHSLDRIDNDGDYCPENCRWATRIQQANNKTNNVRLVANGEDHTLAEWAKLTGVRLSRLRARCRAGWSADRVLSVHTHKKVHP